MDKSLTAWKTCKAHAGGCVDHAVKSLVAGKPVIAAPLQYSPDCEVRQCGGLKAGEPKGHLAVLV